MANQVTIKQNSSVKGYFKASVFNEQGVPVLDGWQEFYIGANQVWNPGKYGAPITVFYIGKGIGPNTKNSFVAYLVKVNFNEQVQDATITLGISEVQAAGEGSPCNIFTANANGVEYEIIKDGILVPGTQLPSRCCS